LHSRLLERAAKVISKDEFASKMNDITESNNRYDYEICTSKIYSFYILEPIKNSPQNNIEIIGTRTIDIYSFGNATTRVSGPAIIDSGFNHPLCGSKPNKIWFFMDKKINNIPKLDDGNKIGDWSDVGLLKASLFDPEYYSVLIKLTNP
jgi:hypothetical protein